MTAFVSYSHIDLTYALRLVSDLREGGVSVWLDKMDIPAGSPWDDAIHRALRDCDTFIVILSPNSAHSQNVLDEIGYAVDEKKKVIPILLAECERPFRLRRLQYIDFSVNYEEGLSRLIQLLAPSQPAPNATSTLVKEGSKGRTRKPYKANVKSESIAKNSAASFDKSEEPYEARAELIPPQDSDASVNKVKNPLPKDTSPTTVINNGRFYKLVPIIFQSLAIGGVFFMVFWGIANFQAGAAAFISFSIGGFLYELGERGVIPEWLSEGLGAIAIFAGIPLYYEVLKLN